MHDAARDPAADEAALVFEEMAAGAAPRLLADDSEGGAVVAWEKPLRVARLPAILPRVELDADAKALVILATARTGRPLAAAESLGYSPAACLAALKADQAFALEVEASMARKLETLEAKVDVRAFEGIEETTTSKNGDYTTTTLKFSDSLAALRLKAEAPRKYADRRELDVRSVSAVMVVPPTAGNAAEWARNWQTAAPPVGDEAAVDVTPNAID
jgi:hypothetical protein